MVTHQMPLGNYSFVRPSSRSLYFILFPSVKLITVIFVKFNYLSHPLILVQLASPFTTTFIFITNKTMNTNIRKLGTLRI